MRHFTALGWMTAASLALGCGTTDETTPAPTDTAVATGDTTGGDTTAPPATTYEPFSQANLENQLVRVGAYDQIQALRKGADFKAADFGGTCEDWSPDVKSPSDPTKIASLFVESASLAEKVKGRKDSHPGGGPVGEALRGAICDAIAAGSVATADKDAVKGIGWHAQVVDKTLQQFFYLSVYHELVQGARKNWDEGVGYFGYDKGGDPAKAGGIAKTAKSRDDNCGTTYARDIFAKLIEGRDLLDKALAAAGKAGNEDKLDAIPADLQATIDDVDAMMLDVFALSFGREMIGLAASDKVAHKLIEGRGFWRILLPSVVKHDGVKGTTYAADLSAMLDQDDPGAVDTDKAIEAVQAVFGFDVAKTCN